LAAAGLVSTSEVLIGVHLWALTEPLYLVLGLAALLLTGAYLAPHARGVFLVLAGLASASALLRRYAGAATVIAGACALGLLQGQERGRKRGDLLLFLLTGRMATFIPTPLNPATGEPRTDYPVALARMREPLRTDCGALVLVDPSVLSSEEVSEPAEGLRLVGEFSDGIVYQRPGD
jgi:hypothetical protein